MNLLRLREPFQQPSYVRVRTRVILAGGKTKDSGRPSRREAYGRIWSDNRQISSLHSERQEQERGEGALEQGGTSGLCVQGVSSGR